jgi:hypothetical protein
VNSIRRLFAQVHGADAANAVFTLLGDNADAVSAFETAPEEWRVEAYPQSRLPNPELGAQLALAAAAAGGTLAEFGEESLPDRDWLAENQLSSLFTARIMMGRCRQERSGLRWTRRPRSVPASIRRPAAVSWLSSAWRADGDFTDRSTSEPEPGFCRSLQPSCYTAKYWPAISTRGRSALPATTPRATASQGWYKAAPRRATVIGSSANHAMI